MIRLDGSCAQSIWRRQAREHSSAHSVWPLSVMQSYSSFTLYRGTFDTRRERPNGSSTLAELRERAKAAGVEVRVEEQQGDPIRVIVLHANARKVDIVVLGSNGRRGWRRLREGSVAESVLRRAAWPVLIVPWDAGTGVLGKKQTRTSSKG